MKNYTIWSVIYILIFAGIGLYFLGNYPSFKSNSNFVLGLDLAGGTELVYTADVTGIPSNEINERMESLKEVIERRVNIFGVSEPIIQVESAGLVSGNTDHRLIVELPAVTDIDQAVAQIGKTPTLEFKLVAPESLEILDENTEPQFVDTGLTGRLVSRAQVSFQGGAQGTGPSEPVVVVDFNTEGAELFEQLTGEHVGEPLAIFLDGELLSAPVIREQISGGQAVVSGSFTIDEAKQLSRDLNFGALPVPITLSTSQVIGPTLGESALEAGIVAAIWSLVLVSLFLIIWYRVPGVVASLALLVYAIVTLTLFKLIPVTLSAAGLAGFVMTIGTAIDANILIFERMKEELKNGKTLLDAMNEGFSRAWPSIRDSNLSNIIIAVILFWVGTASVKGFALTLGLGTLVSMFSAITISRIFLKGAGGIVGKYTSLFMSGITR
ncbi:MAG: protein translocase subunit SecD [Candidatus Zambryskibacteria bacterium CG10_big_fil_rev_8_21_14_0_10_42_12]|uniref:Protein translocase subunit SecD n=1 Tax=Candidatus Zambryskibacteria bacterium CG10_big_fil_rev_8_21_14_0_10_42_12 TaxID=1975115 RepID=A0A2H0QTS9_9BACT|nr:MAG: protein translocase subunit SecD [Candidatus Zambryskibacteria bacterium CG10_big_fil_rev_8_21_14_0_10_42_12]